MRTLSRWIGYGLWLATALVLAYMARAFWPKSHMTTAYVVLLGDSQGIQSTTEVAFQGVVIGIVKSVRLYPQIDTDEMKDRVRAFVYSLERPAQKAPPPIEKAILAEVSIDTSATPLDRPLFADISHSKFTGRPLIDLLCRSGSPIPSRWKPPFILGPFTEETNMVETVEKAVNGALGIERKIDPWWAQGGPEKLDRVGEKVAGLAASLARMEETLHPRDGKPDPVDRMNRGLENLAAKIPSRAPGPADAADLMPGLTTFREEKLPRLQRGLSDLAARVKGEWGPRLEALSRTVSGLSTTLTDAVEALTKTNRKLRDQVQKLEDSNGLVKDMMSGEGK